MCDYQTTVVTDDKGNVRSVSRVRIRDCGGSDPGCPNYPDSDE
jgi:hypothetical protein